jgi:hypothetical protein
MRRAKKRRIGSTVAAWLTGPKHRSGIFLPDNLTPSRHRHRNRQPDGRGREQGDIIAFSMLRSLENIRL